MLFFSLYKSFYVFEPFFIFLGIVLLLGFIRIFINHRLRIKYNIESENQDFELDPQESRLFLNHEKFTTLGKVVRWNALLLMILGIIGIVLIYNNRPIYEKSGSKVKNFYFHESHEFQEADSD